MIVKKPKKWEISSDKKYHFVSNPINHCKLKAANIAIVRTVAYIANTLFLFKIKHILEKALSRALKTCIRNNINKKGFRWFALAISNLKIRNVMERMTTRANASIE